MSKPILTLRPPENPAAGYAKHEEVAILRLLAEAVGPNSYLATLLRPELLDEFEHNLRQDFPTDPWGEAAKLSAEKAELAERAQAAVGEEYQRRQALERELTEARFHLEGHKNMLLDAQAAQAGAARELTRERDENERLRALLARAVDLATEAWWAGRAVDPDALRRALAAPAPEPACLCGHAAADHQDRHPRACFVGACGCPEYAPVLDGLEEVR